MQIKRHYLHLSGSGGGKPALGRPDWKSRVLLPRAEVGSAVASSHIAPRRVSLQCARVLTRGLFLCELGHHPDSKTQPRTQNVGVDAVKVSVSASVPFALVKIMFINTGPYITVL